MSTKKLTQKEFLERCKNIHGEKYDYSGAIYKNSSTKFSVKCNLCNHAWCVSPSNHIGGNKSGCPTCKANSCKERNRLLFDTQWFIATSTKIHNNKFDYSLSTYSNNNTKIDIVCKEHGKFSQ